MTNKIIDESILRISTPRPDRVVEYKKEQLLAQKAEIEAKLAEFDK